MLIDLWNGLITTVGALTSSAKIFMAQSFFTAAVKAILQKHPALIEAIQKIYITQYKTVQFIPPGATATNCRTAMRNLLQLRSLVLPEPVFSE